MGTEFLKNWDLEASALIGAESAYDFKVLRLLISHSWYQYAEFLLTRVPPVGECLPVVSTGASGVHLLLLIVRYKYCSHQLLTDWA